MCKGARVSAGKMKKLWRWMVVTAAQQHDVFNMHTELYT